MEDLIKKHFEFQMDDRYHCNYCSYDTQLINKAFFHLNKKHGDELKAPARKPKKRAGVAKEGTKEGAGN